jgi:hypothetical protein
MSAASEWTTIRERGFFYGGRNCAECRSGSDNQLRPVDKLVETRAGHATGHNHEGFSQLRP